MGMYPETAPPRIRYRLAKRVCLHGGRTRPRRDLRPASPLALEAMRWCHRKRPNDLECPILQIRPTVGIARSIGPPGRFDADGFRTLALIAHVATQEPAAEY